MVVEVAIGELGSCELFGHETLEDGSDHGALGRVLKHAAGKQVHVLNQAVRCAELEDLQVPAQRYRTAMQDQVGAGRTITYVLCMYVHASVPILAVALHTTLHGGNIVAGVNGESAEIALMRW